MAGRVETKEADEYGDFQSAIGITAGIRNLYPSSLAKFQRAMARYEAGLGDVTIVDVGDSTSAGRDTIAVANTQVPNAPMARLAQILRREGYEASADEWWMQRAITTTDDLSDSRITKTGAWAHSARCWFANGAGTLSFTPISAVDTWDIYWVRSGSGSSFTINIGGGSTLATVDTSGSSSVQKTTVSGSLATSALNLVWAAGTVYIVGVVARKSTAKRLRCINFGVSGAVVADINDTTNPWSRRNVLISQIVPDLAIANLAINNWRNSDPVSTFAVTYAALVDALLAGGSSVLVRIPFFDSVISGLSQQQQDYVDAMTKIAMDRNLPIIDMRRRWVSYDAANALGYYSDTVHATATGYTDVARAYRALMRAAA